MKKAKETNISQRKLLPWEVSFLNTQFDLNWQNPATTYPNLSGTFLYQIKANWNLSSVHIELLYHLLITQVNFSILLYSSQTMAIPNELWRLEASIDFHSVEASHTDPREVLRPSEEDVVWKSLKEVVLKTSFTFLATKFTNSFENKFLPIYSFV